MAELLGKVTLVKRLRGNPIWQRSDYGYCWIDLLLLANDAPRRVFANGTAYDLKRGQLLWAKTSLAREWKRSEEWIVKFLCFCQDEGMLTVDSNARRTIITILNYDAYNPPEPATDSAADSGTEPATDSAAEPARNGEMGIGNRKVERARAEKTANDFETSGSEKTEKNAAAVGTAATVSRNKKTAVSFLDSGGPGGPPYLGRTPAQARFEMARELEAVSGRLDAAAELNQPPDAADVRRERELRAGLGN